MAQHHSFADAGRLLTRVLHAAHTGDTVTFLFGSALTAPGTQPNELGVSDANQLIEDVISSFRGTPDFEALESTLTQSPPSHRYQAAMQFVIDCRGQDALNALIREAVLRARVPNSLTDHDPEALEQDIAGWYLRPAVKAVGELVTHHPRVFSQPILTSNFDPLLEISLRKSGASAASIFLPADGQFANVFVPGTTKVVHFHGYWRGSDTLHTPAQLTRNRPQLKGALRSLMRDTTLVVMGYGGWADVFSRTLVEVISEQTEPLNVLWTFYSDSEEDIVTRNETLLNQLEPLAGQRVVFYRGVDCHVLLPTLRDRLAEHSSPLSEMPPRTTSGADTHRPGLGSAGDQPPQSSLWVGREEELRRMLSSQWRVMAITGLGGTGKSTLAAKYLEVKRGAEDVVWYWADCREQRHTVHTQLVRMVEGLSKGRVSAKDLQDSTASDVIEVLLDTVGQHKTVLVFDNIDQYVDLEQRKLVGAMGALVDRVAAAEQPIQIIVTTRPTLEFAAVAFLELALGGLSAQDTRRLFEIAGVVLEPAQISETIAEVHALTRGHALTLNLIATQVAKNKVDLNGLILKLKQGAGAGIEHPVFREIWISLNPKQQTVLRYLAELLHPEPEQRIASYLGNVLNYNQFSKAVKTLRALSLVVIKPLGEGSPDALELHPLVRDFIRRSFPAEQQAPYIDSIIHFCDRMIGRFRGTIESIPYSALENWTAKVELCLRRGFDSEALDALVEVAGPLQKSGYPEEFVRLAAGALTDLRVDDNDEVRAKVDAAMGQLIRTLAYLDRYQEADAWLARFESSVTAKTARYVLLCDIRGYRAWCEGDYHSAVGWARKGADLKSSAGLDTKFDCGHTLALAQRDSGDVSTALTYFLFGEKLELVTAAGEPDATKGGQFYGNVGRCLQLDGRLDEALVCIKKSAKLLETAGDGQVLMNLGWAALWIGEILEAKGRWEKAYIAYRRAAAKWKVSSPHRSRQASDAADRVREKVPLNVVLPTEDWECDRGFIEIVRQR